MRRVVLLGRHRRGHCTRVHTSDFYQALCSFLCPHNCCTLITTSIGQQVIGGIKQCYTIHPPASSPDNDGGPAPQPRLVAAESGPVAADASSSLINETVRQLKATFYPVSSSPVLLADGFLVSVPCHYVTRFLRRPATPPQSSPATIALSPGSSSTLPQARLTALWRLLFCSTVLDLVALRRAQRRRRGLSIGC